MTNLCMSKMFILLQGNGDEKMLNKWQKPLSKCRHKKFLVKKKKNVYRPGIIFNHLLFLLFFFFFLSIDILAPPKLWSTAGTIHYSIPYMVILYLRAETTSQFPLTPSYITINLYSLCLTTDVCNLHMKQPVSAIIWEHV